MTSSVAPARSLRVGVFAFSGYWNLSPGVVVRLQRNVQPGFAVSGIPKEETNENYH
jgi:hypothetical protein